MRPMRRWVNKRNRGNASRLKADAAPPLPPMGRSSARPLYLAEEPPGDEPHLHIASDGRGRVDHLEMAGEGPNGVGSSVAFSARRPKL